MFFKNGHLHASLNVGQHWRKAGTICLAGRTALKVASGSTKFVCFFFFFALQKEGILARVVFDRCAGWIVESASAPGPF